jgi:uncharacterized membrane protein
MKPLIVLLTTFIISIITLRIIQGSFNPVLAGRIALSVMLLFTASGHFIYSKGMTMMIPDFVPYKTQLVFITGVVELLAAIGLLIPDLKTITGIMLIIFFVLILPANIYAAINNINYQTATFTGNGLRYLWFRVPLQFLFIVWTYLVAIKY